MVLSFRRLFRTVHVTKSTQLLFISIYSNNKFSTENKRWYLVLAAQFTTYLHLGFVNKLQQYFLNLQI